MITDLLHHLANSVDSCRKPQMTLKMLTQYVTQTTGSEFDLKKYKRAFRAIDYVRMKGAKKRIPISKLAEVFPNNNTKFFLQSESIELYVVLSESENGFEKKHPRITSSGGHVNICSIWIEKGSIDEPRRFSIALSLCAVCKRFHQLGWFRFFAKEYE